MHIGHTRNHGLEFSSSGAGDEKVKCRSVILENGHLGEVFCWKATQL